MKPNGPIALMTHSLPDQTREAVAAALGAASDAGVEIVADEAEHNKFADLLSGTAVDPGGATDAGLCLVLGGDGTILRALQRFAGTEVPVYAINFGTIGFLAAGEREELGASLEAALSGDFEVMSLPGLDAEAGGRPLVALNDFSLIRRPHGRVAELSYTLGGREVGHVRCDGLVASTPAGSTGYNLANGGPILAWGVEGYVVSFISPHSLTARPLVVAPDDRLLVVNAAGRDAVDLSADGQPVGTLEPGGELEIGFRDQVSRLALAPGVNFYERIRAKFGQLAH